MLIIYYIPLQGVKNPSILIKFYHLISSFLNNNLRLLIHPSMHTWVGVRLAEKGKMKMGILKEVKKTSIFMGKLRNGADLLDELTEICRPRNIRLGRIEAIGAVRKACIGFYDQEKREYEYITIDQPMEITNLTGNISIKDGSPFVHAHITLADSSGRAFGGHLARGTIVFACECSIEVLEGPAFERGFDEDTGLSLWDIKE
jgi:uncharacterized protein